MTESASVNIELKLTLAHTFILFTYFPLSHNIPHLQTRLYAGKKFSHLLHSRYNNAALPQSIFFFNLIKTYIRKHTHSYLKPLHVQIKSISMSGTLSQTLYLTELWRLSEIRTVWKGVIVMISMLTPLGDR